MARLQLFVFVTLIMSCASHPTTQKHKSSASTYQFPFVSRQTWGGRDPILEPTKINFPVPFVVIHHTYQPGVCNTLSECKGAMRAMQNFHQHTNGWSDIGYNFAIGGDGSVYEGRGWNVVGAHAVGYNTRGVGIAFIGDFRTKLPSKAQLEAAQKLIQVGLKRGYISPEYQLLGHKQVSATECPGTALFNEISTWDHFAEHY